VLQNVDHGLMSLIGIDTETMKGISLDQFIDLVKAKQSAPAPASVTLTGCSCTCPLSIQVGGKSPAGHNPIIQMSGRLSRITESRKGIRCTFRRNQTPSP
jgi:hypothetical protein